MNSTHKPRISFVGYADKIANDKFDGTQGFAIEGGIKDASQVTSIPSFHCCSYPVAATFAA